MDNDEGREALLRGVPPLRQRDIGEQEMSDFFKAFKPKPGDGPLFPSPFRRRVNPMFRLSDIVKGDGSEPVENPHVFKARHYVDHHYHSLIDSDLDAVIDDEFGVGFNQRFEDFAHKELCKLASGFGLSGDVVNGAINNATASAISTYTTDRGPSRAEFMADLKAAADAIKALEPPPLFRFIEMPELGVWTGRKKVYKRRGYMRQNKVVDKRRFIPSTQVYRVNPEMVRFECLYIIGHPVTIRKIKKILEAGGVDRPVLDRERFDREWLNKPCISPNDIGGA